MCVYDGKGRGSSYYDGLKHHAYSLAHDISSFACVCIPAHLHTNKREGQREKKRETGQKGGKGERGKKHPSTLKQVSSSIKKMHVSDGGMVEGCREGGAKV